MQYKALPSPLNQIQPICSRSFEYMFEDGKVAAKPFRMIKKNLNRVRPEQDFVPRSCPDYRDGHDMAFSDDGGGFAFSCADAKMSIGASTWATRLSQIGTATGEILILTRALPDIDYITRTLDKRPKDIWIVAHTDSTAEAKALKAARPWIRIAVHPDIGAKAVFVAPETVWISSSNFGKAVKLESAVGFHSADLYVRTRSQLFEKAWAEGHEL